MAAGDGVVIRETFVGCAMVKDEAGGDCGIGVPVRVMVDGIVGKGEFTKPHAVFSPN